MAIDRVMQEALQSPDPVGALRALAERLLAEGEPPPSVLATFEQARQTLRAENRERDEDAVMDVMDFLVGWCSPHMKLPADDAPAQSPVQ